MVVVCIFAILLQLSGSEKIYGYLDLYKPQEQELMALYDENPAFLGNELGPAAYLALEKVHANYTGEKYCDELELLTYVNITMTQWDINKTRSGSNMTDCGDVWKTSRCIERLIEEKKYPTLILGSHKPMPAQASMLYALLNNAIFTYTSADLIMDSPQGRDKENRGFDNMIRFMQPVNVDKSTHKFLTHFNWTDHLLLFYDKYEATLRALPLITQINIHKTTSVYGQPSPYPFSYATEKFKEFDPEDYDPIDYLTPHKAISDRYFRGNDLKNYHRIVILFGSQRMVRDLMLQAYDAGMTENNEYVFIIIPTNYFPLYTWKGQDDAVYFNMSQRGLSRDEDAHKAFQSAFIVTAEIDTTSFDSFSKAVKERAKDTPFNYEFPETRELPLYAANYHDAVLLWAYAINHYYDSESRTLNVSKLYNKKYNKTDFNDIEPVTGTIELDEYGDRKNSFIFWHLDDNGEWEQVGRYADEQYTELVNESDISWPANGKKAPLAEPVCGFRGEKCPDNSLRDIGISVGGGALVFLGLGLLVLTHMYRKAKFEAELSAMSWKIPLHEMKACGKGHLGSSVFGTRSRLTLGSVASDGSIQSNGRDQSYKLQFGYFSRQARYQNKVVALKSVLSQYFGITRALMIEMKTLKELRNENLLAVNGAVIEPDMCYLVTEFCNKGSLQDILENDDVKLDDMLNFSLINDLVKGMGFLHASVIGSHGYLKSSNCIINNHFSLKISDYSRSIFMSDMDRLHRAAPETRNERLVYRAPELLRLQCIPCQGTKEGDMYSFGIIVHEILIREGPFGLSSMECDLTSTEVINLVTKTDIQTPFRPEFPFTSDSKLARAIAMSREAWVEDPFLRPTFRALRTTLRLIRPDPNISGGIVENLLSRMEKYATNLEEVVEERTAQLQVEKKRTDDLLESMLPKSVADQLKSGNLVPPEWFDCVSIYFSDIVGFTNISSSLKPIQVMDMLNDMYTVFDECIEKYDCYKVETIGDAYMAVSGLPIRNGDRHAAQIGLMSLDFLTCVSNFVIKHAPDIKLRIRIGMHSGPVVAGIVGTKMPRYCLFGDTVNTASRMESNGEEMKIQMSEESYNIMANHGGFIIEPRGLVEMKGKGKIPTYWLQGVQKDLNLSNPRNFTDQAQLMQKLTDSQVGSYQDIPNYNTNSHKDKSPGLKLHFPKLSSSVKHEKMQEESSEEKIAQYSDVTIPTSLNYNGYEVK